MSALIALSTSSIYPETTSHGFEYASRLGFDAVEVMVGSDAASQDFAKVRTLRDYHEIPVCAVHAPCLLITQRVWGTDPWGKLEMSAEMAHEVGAPVVVVHPPFRWQKEYAAEFIEGIASLEAQTEISFAVENMYPWRATSKREMEVYLPGWDVSLFGFHNLTLDVSHAATSSIDSLDLAKRMGDRLRHLHMTDGTGSAKDEHLVPGRGNQPCVELLEHLAQVGFDGSIVLEINTRKAGTRQVREADLMESLDFCREHFRPA